MVSTLKLTKIQIPNSDSDVLSFNSSTGVMTFHKDIQGEGTATTNLQQGLCKHFCHFDGSGTVEVDDSFNQSTLTDNSTGNYTVGISNNMNNISFTVTGSTMGSDGSYNSWITGFDGTLHTTSQYRLRSYHVSAGAVDQKHIQCQVVGDLA